MTYRDRDIDCPRCRTQLARVDETDRWTCPRCKGQLAGVVVVIRELLVVAPKLAPEGGIGDLSTISRRAEAELACPLCAAPMDPVFLGGVEIDRCRADHVIWFDARELDTVVEIARGQARRSWLSMFFGS